MILQTATTTCQTPSPVMRYNLQDHRRTQHLPSLLFPGVKAAKACWLILLSQRYWSTALEGSSHCQRYVLLILAAGKLITVLFLKTATSQLRASVGLKECREEDQNGSGVPSTVYWFHMLEKLQHQTRGAIMQRPHRLPSMSVKKPRTVPLSSLLHMQCRQHHATTTG